MKQLNFSLKPLVLTMAGCALLGISATVFATPIITNGQTFTIQEGSIFGTSNNQFDADRFNGSYNEIFTATSPTDFQAKTIFSFGSYALDGGGAITSYLNGPNPNGYKLYATLTTTGTFTTSGTTTSFTATNNKIEIWADPSSDTDINALPSAATDPYSFSGNGDDVKLAFATTGSGMGSIDTGGSVAPGNFGIVFTDFALTPDGKNYFINPVPFYMNLEANGNFNPFDPESGSSYTVKGAANGFFTAVPGPGSLGLAMLGLGLLGLGFVTRRSQSTRDA